jgi:hypothetical protein
MQVRGDGDSVLIANRHGPLSRRYDNPFQIAPI